MNFRLANKLIKRNASYCGHLHPITGRWVYHYRKTTRRRALRRASTHRSNYRNFLRKTSTVGPWTLEKSVYVRRCKDLTLATISALDSDELIARRKASVDAELRREGWTLE